MLSAPGFAFLVEISHPVWTLGVMGTFLGCRLYMTVAVKGLRLYVLSYISIMKPKTFYCLQGGYLSFIFIVNLHAQAFKYPFNDLSSMFFETFFIFFSNVSTWLVGFASIIVTH